MSNINFTILNNFKNGTFYNDVFLDKINTIITTYMNNNIIITDYIKNNQKEDQKKIIISNNIIPLSYLIFGYIYTKFFHFQLRKKIYIMNNLNYDMYKFVFSHKNPIIKKVNVFFYNEFQKIDKNNTINTSKSTLVSNIINENNETIKFLTILENIFQKDMNNPFYLNIFDTILKNINSCFEYINNINTYLEEIKYIFNNITNDNNINELKNIINYLLNTNSNKNNQKKYFYQDIFNAIDKLNNENKILIKKQYNNLFIIYVGNILPIINNINLNIININDINNDKDYFKIIIKYNKFNYYSLINMQSIINGKKKDLNKDKDNLKKKLNILTEIQNSIDDQNDLYSNLPINFNDLEKCNSNINSSIIQLFKILMKDNILYFGLNTNTDTDTDFKKSSKTTSKTNSNTNSKTSSKTNSNSSSKISSNSNSNSNSSSNTNSTTNNQFQKYFEYLKSRDKINPSVPIKNYYSMFILIFLYFLYIYQKYEYEYVISLYKKKEYNIFNMEINSKEDIKSIINFYNSILKKYNKNTKDSIQNKYIENLNSFIVDLKNYKDKINISSKLITSNINKNNLNKEKKIEEDKISNITSKINITTNNINDLKDYKIKIVNTLGDNSALFNIYKNLIPQIFNSLNTNNIIEIINNLLNQNFNIQRKNINETIFNKLNITNAILSINSTNTLNITRTINLTEIEQKIIKIKSELDKKILEKTSDITDLNESIVTIQSQIKSLSSTNTQSLASLRTTLSQLHSRLNVLNSELNTVKNNISTVERIISNFQNKNILAEIYKYLLENLNTRDSNINNEINNILNNNDFISDDQKITLSNNILKIILNNTNFNKLYLLLNEFKNIKNSNFNIIYPYDNFQDIIDYYESRLKDYKNNIKKSKNNINKIEKNKANIEDLIKKMEKNKELYYDKLNTFISDLDKRANNLIKDLKVNSNTTKKPVIDSKPTISSNNLKNLNQLFTYKPNDQQYILLYTFMESLTNTPNITKKVNNFKILNIDNMIQSIKNLYNTLSSDDKNKVNDYIIINLYTPEDKLTITNLIDQYTKQNKSISSNFKEMILFEKIGIIFNFFNKKKNNSIPNVNIGLNSININNFNETFTTYQNNISTFILNLSEDTKKIKYRNDKNKLYFLITLDKKLKNCIDSIIKDYDSNIINITSKISSYFANLNKNSDNFISQLKEHNIFNIEGYSLTNAKSGTKSNSKSGIKSDTKESLTSFKNEYTNYTNELYSKINSLLTNINNKKLSLIPDYNNSTIIETFKTIISTKMEKIESINNNKNGTPNNNNTTNNSNNKNNNKSNNIKSSIIMVLPYTDIMFEYLIYLLIIIDFLSFYYE